MRVNKRESMAIRPIKITPGIIENADGSCMIEVGKTRVICTASIACDRSEKFQDPSYFSLSQFRAFSISQWWKSFDSSSESGHVLIRRQKEV